MISIIGRKWLCFVGVVVVMSLVNMAMVGWQAHFQVQLEMVVPGQDASEGCPAQW